MRRQMEIIVGAGSPLPEPETSLLPATGSYAVGGLGSRPLPRGATDRIVGPIATPAIATVTTATFGEFAFDIGGPQGWSFTVSNSLTVASVNKPATSLNLSGNGTFAVTGAVINSAGNFNPGSSGTVLNNFTIGGTLTNSAAFNMNVNSATLAEISSSAGGNIYFSNGTVASRGATSSTSISAAGLSGSSGNIQVKNVLTSGQIATASLALNSASNFTSAGTLRDFVSGTSSGTSNAKLSLSKAGEGTQILTGTTLTYGGATNVTDGKLLINGSGVLGANGSDGAAAAAVEVNGGTFGGSGTVNRIINVSTDLQAGSGTGFNTLKVGADLNFATDSTITLALGAMGTEHSTLQRNSGTWVFDLAQTFNLIDLGITADELTPTLYTNVITGLAGPAVTAGWNIDPSSGYTGVFTANGNNVDLSLVAIPEPSALAMLAGGLGFLTLRRRRLS